MWCAYIDYLDWETRGLWSPRKKIAGAEEKGFPEDFRKKLVALLVGGKVPEVGKSHGDE